MNELTPEDLADLNDGEEVVPVVIAVHNGVVVDGQAMFVPIRYEVPILELRKVQIAWGAYEILGGTG